MMHHTFSNRRKIWTAGRPDKHTHSMPTKPRCCNKFLGKVMVLMAEYVSPEFQHKPLHQWYLHIRLCRSPMPWPFLIPSQRLLFALFVGNSLDGLFHLWHVESDVRFSQKQAEMWTREESSCHLTIDRRAVLRQPWTSLDKTTNRDWHSDSHSEELSSFQGEI